MRFQYNGPLSVVMLIYIWCTVFLVVMRYCFTDQKDPFKCGVLMNEGSWRGPAPQHSDDLRNWDLPGCLLHKYKDKDMQACFSSRRVVFIGDSSMRTAFWAMARVLDPEAAEALKQGEKHSDAEFKSSQVKLEFVWDPYLNSSRLPTEIGDFKRGKRESVQGGGSKDEAALVVVGGGLWHAKNIHTNGLKVWKDSLDQVAQHMRRGNNQAMDMTKGDLLLLAPVPLPAWTLLTKERKENIEADMIWDMNNYLKELSSKQGIDVLHSWNEMLRQYPLQAAEGDGIHPADSVAAKQVDILLNLACNAKASTKYPYNKTCCYNYSPPRMVQWTILLATVLVLPLLLAFHQDVPDSGRPTFSRMPMKTLYSLFLIALSLLFCFYADRTQVFHKYAKVWSPTAFSLMTLGSCILGLVTIRFSTTNQPFLSRDQTDEWKGWMQFVILIYHYTGASSIIPVYGFVRLLVASYLFMTGFGHTVFFIKKGDYSLKRAAGVLLRLNILSCLLPYMMNTDYLFYYFAPLVSFWFCVIYITMRVQAHRNGSPRFLFSKIATSALLVTILTKVPLFFDLIFMFLGIVCRMSWDVTEWRFRLSLDMWIVYVGMVVAVMFVEASSNTPPNWFRYSPQAVIASAVALPLWLVYQFSRTDKYSYNAFHPYFSWIPIIAFVILRNATQRVRNMHSGAFAWLGRCSLETFTLQFHIWMAADTKGLLDLGIFADNKNSRILNFLWITPIFIYISWCVASATGDVTAWILGGASRSKTPSVPIHKRTESALKEEENLRMEAAPEGNGVTVSSEKIVPMGGQGKENIATRLGLILGVMWVLNWIY